MHEVEGENWLPKYAISLANNHQQEIHCIGKNKIFDEIKSNLVMGYVWRFIEQANEEEANSEGKINTQERYDKSVRNKPQEGEEKWSYNGLADTPNDTFNVSRHQ